MQQITRRPKSDKKTLRRKKSVHGAKERDKRRQARRATRNRQRKLKQKLSYLVDEIGCGRLTGVKESPLLAANLGFAMRMLKRRSGFGA